MTRQRNAYANELKKRVNAMIEASGKADNAVSLCLGLMLLNKAGMAVGDIGPMMAIRGYNNEDTEKYQMFKAVVPDVDGILDSVRGKPDDNPKACAKIREAVYWAPEKQVAGDLLRDLLRDLFNFTRPTEHPGGFWRSR